jgi:hypothetical protein
MTTPNETPTPRTDAKVRVSCIQSTVGTTCDYTEYNVDADFARTLERENIQLKEALSSGLCSEHQEPDPLNCETCNNVSWLRKANFRFLYQISVLEDELSAAKTEVERLEQTVELEYEGRMFLAQQISLIEKRVLELREKLNNERELTDKGYRYAARLKEVLEKCADALETCYNVVEYPGDGTGRQAEALTLARAELDATK